MAPKSNNPDKPGGRKPPSPVSRWFARAPRHLYQIRLGWLLGHRFVLLEHIGRISGLPRSTVLEVIHRESEYIDVAAAWGVKSDWFRNVAKHPAVWISSGRDRQLPAEASVLERHDATAVFRMYVQTHRTAAKGLAKVFDLPFGDADAMADAVPVVRLRLLGNEEL